MNAEAIIAPAPYVLIGLASSITGLTEKAIRRKIEDGQRDAQEMARLEAAYPQAIPRPPSKSNSSL